MLRQNLKKFRLIALTGVTATTGVSTVFLPEFDISSLTLKVAIANVSGSSPTLDLYAQTSDDGGTTWYDTQHFTQFTAATTNPVFGTITIDAGTNVNHGAVGSKTVTTGVGIPQLDRQVRLAYTIGGTTPTFDITVDALLNNFDGSR